MGTVRSWYSGTLAPLVLGLLSESSPNFQAHPGPSWIWITLEVASPFSGSPYPSPDRVGPYGVAERGVIPVHDDKCELAFRKSHEINLFESAPKLQITKVTPQHYETWRDNAAWIRLRLSQTHPGSLRHIPAGIPCPMTYLHHVYHLIQMDTSIAISKLGLNKPEWGTTTGFNASSSVSGSPFLVTGYGSSLSTRIASGNQSQTR